MSSISINLVNDIKKQKDPYWASNKSVKIKKSDIESEKFFIDNNGMDWWIIFKIVFPMLIFQFHF